MDRRFHVRKLKDLALRKAAVVCSSCSKMYVFAAKMKDANKDEFEPEIDKVSRGFLANFSLPLMLEEELLGAMKATTREVIKWVKFHENFMEQYDGSFHRLVILERLRWTRLGIVAYEATAKVLIRTRLLTIEECYKLACLYCLRRDIKDLWRKLPDSSRKEFFNEDPLRVGQPRIVRFFSCLLRDEGHHVYVFLRVGERYEFSAHENMFEYVALQGYRKATKYFLEKLRVLGRLHIAKRVALNVARKRSFDRCSYLHEYQKYSDVVFLLMSRMSENEKRDLCRSAPFEILKCFLDWPRQSHFFKHAKFVLGRRLLTEEEYSRLLYILAHNISSGFNYPRMFRVFFLMSPKRYKEYTLDNYAHFLREFISLNDVATVKFIFKHLNVEEKVELLSGNSLGSGFIRSLVAANRWDFLRLFIRECQVAKESKDRLVKSFRFRFLDYQRDAWFERFVHEIRADQSDAKYDRWALDCDSVLVVDLKKRREDDNTEQPKKLLRTN